MPPNELREGILEKLFEVAEIAKFTPEEAMAYEDSLKTYRDLKNSLDTAREEGHEEGREEGREKGIEEGIELVLKVLKLSQKGWSLAQIAEGTGISVSRVRAVLDQINEA